MMIVMMTDNDYRSRGKGKPIFYGVLRSIVNVELHEIIAPYQRV